MRRCERSNTEGRFGAIYHVLWWRPRTTLGTEPLHFSTSRNADQEIALLVIIGDLLLSSLTSYAVQIAIFACKQALQSCTITMNVTRVAARRKHVISSTDPLDEKLQLRSMRACLIASANRGTSPELVELQVFAIPGSEAKWSAM